MHTAARTPEIRSKRTARNPVSRMLVSLGVVGATLLLLATAAQAVTETRVNLFGQVTQAQIDDEGNLNFISSWFGETNFVSCEDALCNSYTDIVIPVFEFSDAYGYVIGDSPMIAGYASFQADPILAVCATPNCSETESITPLPFVGELFINSQGNLVVFETFGRRIFICDDPQCAPGGNTIHTAPVRGDGYLDSDDRPVFVTSTEVVSCLDPTCTSSDRVAHDLGSTRSAVRGINGNPLVGVTQNIGEITYGKLATCLDPVCAEFTITELFKLAESSDLEAIAGTPNMAIGHDFGPVKAIFSDTGPTCVATWSGDQYTLAFDGDFGDSTHLRINGKWKGNLTGLQTYDGTGDGNDTDGYVIRHWESAISFTDVPCSVEGNPGGDLLISDCIVTRADNGSATIRFKADSSSANLRRDGKWIAGVKNESQYFDAQAGNTYVLVRRIDGVKTSFPCVDDVDPPAGCSIDARGELVKLSWTDEGDRYIIRRNGKWLTTLGKNVSSYTGADLDGATYTLRARQADGTIVDTPCI